MKLRAILTMLVASVALSGQEGHPLVGSWHGSLGDSPAKQTDATFVLKFDGTNITGMINPGLEVMKLQTATLDPSTWTVHLEADTKDVSGKVVRVVIEGKIQNITNPRRTIVGTWTQGTTKAPLKMTRDD
ncbi:MAG: hypothetical protein ABI811_05010 [Acidobacteriota bacterium]